VKLQAVSNTAAVTPSEPLVEPHRAGSLTPAIKIAPTAYYIVKSGDTLFGITEKLYGNPNKWPWLYDANKKTVGDNPNLIVPGEKITATLGDRPDYGPVIAAVKRARQVVSDYHAAAGVTTEVVRPSVGGGTLDCAGLASLWEAAGGSSTEAFMASEIAMAESGGRQYALSPTDDYGYWQINGSHGPGEATFNAYGNARAAVAISDDGTNWTPWTTFTSGAYEGRC
jgi:hypothetical protein